MQNELNKKVVKNKQRDRTKRKESKPQVYTVLEISTGRHYDYPAKFST